MSIFQFSFFSLLIFIHFIVFSRSFFKEKYYTREKIERIMERIFELGCVIEECEIDNAAKITENSKEIKVLKEEIMAIKKDL